MAISRKAKVESELEDAAIADAVGTYVSVQARDWKRRQLNRVLPGVFALVDAARAKGDAPDVPAIIRQVFLKREIPQPEELA